MRNKPKQWRRPSEARRPQSTYVCMGCAEHGIVGYVYFTEETLPDVRDVCELCSSDWAAFEVSTYGPLSLSPVRVPD